jgi:hypothetical protein
MSTTVDLAKFGFREIEMLRDILDAWVKHGLPEDFSGEGVHPMFNMNSGNVFLTNEEFQVAMMNGDTLESFYSCPECGHEGFAEEMREGSDCCTSYMEELKGY